MTEEPNANEEKRQGKDDPAPTQKTEPVHPPAPPTTGIAPQENVTSQLGTEKPKEKCDKSKEIVVRVLEDDALSSFETKTLFWGRIGIILAIATFVVGALTLIIFYRQLDLMRTQLQDAESDGRTASRHARQQISALQSQVKAIQTQTRQDQRPWLGIDMNWPTIKNPTGEVVGRIVSVTENIPLGIPLRITNSGKTAARKVHADIWVQVVKTTEEPRLNAPKSIGWFFKAGLIQPGSLNDFVAYRQRPQATGIEAMSNLLPSEKSDLMNGNAYLAVHGKITYVDGFNIDHWTKFCNWVPLSLTPRYYVSQDCSAYNDVDEN
jgi:hypothetical protein